MVMIFNFLDGLVEWLNLFVLIRVCFKSPTIENVAKLYFEFLGEDLPGFKNLGGLTLE